MKTVTLLFLRREGQILLAMKKRGFGEGNWNGVGGKIEEGETPESAMIRECQEEIEVTPTKYHKVAEIEFDELHNNGRTNLSAHVFVATEWDGEPTETEEMAPKWFNVEDIPYEQMWADDPFWLPLVLKGKLLECNFSLDDQNKVTSHSVKEVQSLSN